MNNSAKNDYPPGLIRADDLEHLLKALGAGGFRIQAPVIRDQSIVIDEIKSAGELPAGWTDEQNRGHYRIKRRSDNAYFGYVVGPYSWKKYLFPPSTAILEAKRTGNGFQVSAAAETVSPTVFFGIRPCDLKALQILDRVLIGSEYRDPIYQKRREQIFIVAVNCTEPGGNCFCTSMESGPGAAEGYDIVLTEMIDARQHNFLAQAGTERGNLILQQVPSEKATSDALKSAAEAVQMAARKMSKKIDTADIKEMLYANAEHPRWEDVAKRCLSCANCTLVCPTCFCANIDDYTDLTGETATRVRRWDSCFTLDHSYIHGGSIRSSVRARYRQWLTHKLAAWHDQFGSSGCVGCGRCITWCPSGIDITEEVAAIRSGSVKAKAI